MTSTGKQYRNPDRDHRKHPPLAKPDLGEWGRNEFAFIGAPCNVIRDLTQALTQRLASAWKVCYVDADHADADIQPEPQFTGAALFTDKIHSRRLDTLEQPGTFQRRRWLSDFDVILINGNHFDAFSQIVLLHSKKLESLQRKTDRLKHVIAVVETDTTLDACGWMKKYLTSETQIFTSDEQDQFANWLAGQIRTPEVRGLVLAGGKSTRMGSDKSVIDYHGKPHREYLLSLLHETGVPHFLSCRPDQVEGLQADNVVADRFLDLGPFGAILSAMLSAPDSAWLVLATDLPFVNEQTLQTLLEHRDPSKIATAFHNPETNFPEPLITLWEPKAYPVMLSFLTQGISCPRKVLINSDVHVIEAGEQRWLQNVNTPEEMRAAREMLG